MRHRIMINGAGIGQCQLSEELKGGSLLPLWASGFRQVRLADTSLPGSPFMAGELGDRFSLEKAMLHGMVPLVWMSTSPEETLQAYVSLYFREEVQQEGLVRNIGSFSRFLEAVGFSHGSVLNLSAVARECEVSRKTVENSKPREGHRSSRTEFHQDPPAPPPQLRAGLSRARIQAYRNPTVVLVPHPSLGSLPCKSPTLCMMWPSDT